MDLPDSALPGLYQGADKLSIQAQSRHLSVSRLRLVLVVIAAAGGAFSVRIGSESIEIAALVTVVALVGAIVTELWLLVEKPELSWYDGRALAESAKTLAWRFAVCATPYERESDVGNDREAEFRFVSQLESLLRDAPRTAVAPTTAPPVSSQLRILRSATLTARRDCYLEQRIDNQSIWYARKSGWNIRRARRWRIALLSLEVVGVIAAVFRMINFVELDLAGIVAATIGAGVAWLATKQHESLGRAYAFAANELCLARTRLEGAVTEQDWAREVADAEEAISREHTMWRASRSSH